MFGSKAMLFSVLLLIVIIADCQNMDSPAAKYVIA